MGALSLTFLLLFVFVHFLRFFCQTSYLCVCQCVPGPRAEEGDG